MSRPISRKWRLTHLPGAAGGDAHLLVVVALAAAGREGVAQPEAVFGGDAVGDVGEGGGALVGGDDEVGIVAVAADHRRPAAPLRRRHRLSVMSSSPRIRVLVAGDALGLRAPRGRVGSGGCLTDEAALGADRDDHRVLDHLRLHQAEDLGAEVLAPVRPADAAARDLAAAQVDALHAPANRRRSRPSAAAAAGRRRRGCRA